MKYFIVIFAVLALASADEDFKPKTVEEMEVVGDACREAYPVSPKELARLWILDIPDSPEVREHLVCFVKGIGTYSSEGGFDIKRIAAQHHIGSDEPDLLAHIENCVNQVNNYKDNEGKYVRDGFVCILNSEIGKRFQAQFDPVTPDNVKQLIATLLNVEEKGVK